MYNSPALLRHTGVWPDTSAAVGSWGGQRETAMDYWAILALKGTDICVC